MHSLLWRYFVNCNNYLYTVFTLYCESKTKWVVLKKQSFFLYFTSNIYSKNTEKYRPETVTHNTVLFCRPIPQTSDSCCAMHCPQLPINQRYLYYTSPSVTVITRKPSCRMSLTNPLDAKACQKLLQFDVLTTLSLTILVYILIRLAVNASKICEIPAKKFSENSNL